MTRLLGRTGTVIIVFIAAILIARLVGSARPRPALFSALFTNPDGSACERPCIFGVQPGKMTSQEAIAILKRHPATRNMKLLDDGATNAGFAFVSRRLSVVVGASGQWIGLAFPNHPGDEFPITPDWLMSGIPLGAAIVELGSPDFVGIDTHSPTINLRYFRSGLTLIYVRHSEQYMLPDDLPIVLTINSGELARNEQQNGWHGFGRVERYVTYR